MPLSNARLADLLYGAADNYEDNKQRALRRAGRYALVWPEEAHEVAASGRSLRDLPAVGPFVARQIHEWLEDPPEMEEPDPLRSGFITFAEAQSILAEHPEYREGLRGDLQMHSTYSDGTVPIAGMAGAACKLGYEYIAMTDHSKGLRIAGGIDEAELLAQGQEVAEVNKELDKLGADLKVLWSTELNLGPVGEADMEADALRKLDIVVGSFHSKLRVKVDQTDRCIGAARNPEVQVIGHPSGRMFGVRHGVQADWPRFIEEGARYGKAFEINAQPNRQDLSIEKLKLAMDAGVMISIGTDAHSIGELGNIDLSLAAAAAVGIPKERILNFKPLDELLEWVEGSRDQAKRAGES